MRFCLFFQKNKSGEILNINSLAGITTWASYSLYCSTKHAVTGFTEALRREVDSQGIKVMNLCPGSTNTQVAVKAGYVEDRSQYMDPVDIADIAVYMLMQPSKVNMANVEAWMVGWDVQS